FGLKLIERLLVLQELIHAVSMILNIVFLQKGIKFESGEVKKTASLIMRQLPGTVALNHQGLERFSPRIRVLGEIIRKMDIDFHIETVPYMEIHSRGGHSSRG